MFSSNNSLANGRKKTADLSKLMLRAYNAEADICVRTLRAGNLTTAITRLNKAATTITKLGAMMDMHLADTYHALRIRELELTADYLMKAQEEKEAARAEREHLREERKVEQELAAQREKLDNERAHYRNVLTSIGGTDPQEKQRILDKIADLDKAIEDNDHRQANIRAGYVYVISNQGAFGPNVVKIGMTRRLDPTDRVRELGSASVPFPFDTHALYFSDDAITLENKLHNAFTGQRLNHANPRREFFFATPAQVRDVLAAHVGNLLEYPGGHPIFPKQKQLAGGRRNRADHLTVRVPTPSGNSSRHRTGRWHRSAAERGRGDGKARRRKAVTHIGRGPGWIAPGRGRRADRLMDPYPVEVEQIHHELVRMFGLDAELRQLRVGEVPQVRGDDDLGAGADRRGQHMPVVLIRQRECGDEFLVAGDQAVRYRPVHQLP